MLSRSNFWTVAGASYAAADGIGMPTYANLDLLMLLFYHEVAERRNNTKRVEAPVLSDSVVALFMADLHSPDRQNFRIYQTKLSVHSANLGYD